MTLADDLPPEKCLEARTETISFQTDMECLDRAAKLAEDPAALKRALGEE